MSIQGSIFGLAYGDALGAPTEFMSMKAITKRYGNLGLDNLPKGGKVTDDTQMMMAVGEAITSLAQRDFITPDNAVRYLANAFVGFHGETDGSRAPGGSCMSACLRLKNGAGWLVATNPNAKGCGANMRVTPIGLTLAYPGPDRKLVGWLSLKEAQGLAQLQAGLTHGHATALAAADATMYATHLFLRGQQPRAVIQTLIEYADQQRYTYHHDWLGPLWQMAGKQLSPEAFIRLGWLQVTMSLRKVQNAMRHPDSKADPCLTTGAGWVAEEALATALHCAALYPNDPMKAVRRGAASSGDSDSIAAITGAFMGARHGLDAFPTDWYTRIEYRDRLDQLVTALS